MEQKLKDATTYDEYKMENKERKNKKKKKKN